MMRTEDLERLERAIEDDRRRRIEEIEEAYRRDLGALEITRFLIEKYAGGPEPPPPDPTEPLPEEPVTTRPGAPDDEEEPEGDGEQSLITQDLDAPAGELPNEDPKPPADGGGSAEEEQSVESTAPVVDPIDHRELVEAGTDQSEHASEQEESQEVEDPGEPKKPCMRCGAPKPLSAFGKDVRTSDGRAKTCIACKSQAGRAAAEKREEKKRAAAEEVREVPEEEPEATVTALAPQTRAAEPERPASTAEKGERWCANGEGCVAFPRTGKPTKLNEHNKGSVCYSCEERETVFGSRPVGTLSPIVRKPGVGDEGATGG